ncbi:ABC transporter substrate-binding protein [Kineosporia sp. NBRC 101731]|uniref:ABC transporter substrate-binding protein n=1 Tax=Kineosporia sp. NBRC 101731 TaxID=3032199 RepID=UPI0024A15600|nr:ABC transporter substrate-binding protein [Kineosporia sp. NBRC 101731]GLY30903.1 peptide ABC transporter substrate-binding protein [Kineosporia sp. NBRC 101731]
MFLTAKRARSRKGRALGLTAGLAVAGLLATGCSGSSGNGSGSGGGTTTLVAYTGQSGDYQINFNPFSPTQIGGGAAIYEQLFFINKAGSGDPEPLLGTDYAWNDEGTQLSVTLRDGVKWTDGEAFTADDVVFTFGLLKKHAALNSIGYDGSATATDDTHVVFTFDKPAYTQGPDVLGNTYMVPEHLWKDVNPETDVMEKPVGTGPLKLGDFKAQAFTYVANEDYWGGAPAIKTVRFLSLSGNTAGADGVAAGTIDWQTGPVPNIDKVAETYPGYDSATVNQSQTALLTCSSADMGCTGPQTDPAVRRAIYHAIDRKQLNALAFQNTSSEISPTFVLTSNQKDLISSSIEQPVAPDTADVAAATSELEGAGWSKGSDGIYAKGGEKLSLTVEVVTGWTDYITAVQTMAQQLKKAGIELKVAQSSWNEWTEKKTQGKYELAIDSLYQGSAPDPYYVYNNFFASSAGAKVGKTSGNNVSRFSDPDVDAAIKALRQLPQDDKAARQPFLDTIETKIVEDMPYIPVLTGGTTSEWSTKKFTGWPSDDNMYAVPAVWSKNDFAAIIKNLKPAS